MVYPHAHPGLMKFRDGELTDPGFPEAELGCKRGSECVMALPNPLSGRNRRNPATNANFKANLKLALLQEETHRRIAAELHDSTCQHLVAASLALMQIKRALDEPLKADAYCEQVAVSIDRALQELRSLTYLLHPQNLAEEGLKATIERYAEEFAARTSLVVEVSISQAVEKLTYETQRSAMRIAQEALTNVCRHARATNVAITIEERDGEFRLEVRDNGQGMAADRSLRKSAPTPGTGLRIMRARLRELGGRLEIVSEPASLNRGTVLCAIFPSVDKFDRRERGHHLGRPEQPARRSRDRMRLQPVVDT